ncbi:MAG: mechanosensitive ion channel family protein [Thermoplasmata archaeon]|nr:mechanosensitive ion channel family protein [Thermoplasmata archaeon]MCI4338050.1 mechanosensitive ion channel family protein [Thermoplasmata archaeon]MCI4341801.1 mechanosensitive ion channel family protein [Thermoplasmata archaeon]
MSSNTGGMLRRVGQGLAITLVVAAAVVIAIRLVELAFHLAPGSTLVQGFEVAGVLVVGYTLSHRLTAAIKVWAAQNDRLSQVTAIGLLLDGVVAAGAVFALFAVFNVGLSTLLFGGALTGVVLALASQTLLANAFSGLSLIVAAPFRNGDRVSIISSSFGTLAPTYAHEMLSPAYTGRVLECGLFYTTLRLDTGQIAQVPNSVVIAALVVIHGRDQPHRLRIRVTLPHTVSLEQFSRAVAHPANPYAAPPPGFNGPEIRVAEIAPLSWDAVVTVWTLQPDDDQVRDQFLRVVLPQLALTPPAESTPAAASPAERLK